MMERKIGEIFEYNGEWYQCVEGNWCGRCGLHKPNLSASYCDYRLYCLASKRKDRKSVIFKKLEKVGEPITVNGKNVQLLKTTIANCDNCAFYKDVNCDFTCYSRKCYGGEEGTYVEIKTKEDMEEKKLNLKPFDIQKAREGKPVCTKDGRKARIICFDSKNDPRRPIIALVEHNDNELLYEYTIEGKDRFSHISTTGTSDLMMLPEKKEGWVNVYKGNNGIPERVCGDIVSNTREEAIQCVQYDDSYITTVKISWEE